MNTTQEENELAKRIQDIECFQESIIFQLCSFCCDTVWIVGFSGKFNKTLVRKGEACSEVMMKLETEACELHSSIIK